MDGGKARFTPGPWSVGKCRSVVVTPARIDGAVNTGHNRDEDKTEVDYYGGNLIAESIWRIEDACLIASALDMYDALVEFRGSLYFERNTESVKAKTIAAILKAEALP